MRALGLIITCALFCADAAPKGRNHKGAQTVYDQKQTGDYNIQLHLKDFQIIALLADDTLAGLGDYDYNYDYSDFTVKPPNSTQKPSSTTSVISTSTTSTTTESAPSTSTAKLSTTEFTTSTIPPEKSSTHLVVEVTEKAKITTPETTTSNQPDRIKVQIIEGPKMPENIAIVPSDDLGLNNEASAALGEILYYRRCASGYARDKKGRCRRVRKPSSGQVPFDLSRLASNLAARFRQETSLEGSSGSESASGSESVESAEA